MTKPKSRLDKLRGLPGDASPDSTLVVRSPGQPKIRVMAYGPLGYLEQEIEDLEDLCPILAAWPVTWVDVDGLGNRTMIQKLGAIFELHQLALEDVIHVHQRAKVEHYGPYVFIIARMLTFEQHLQTEQLSMFLGEKFLLTFQEEHPGDCLEGVRHQIRTGGRVRQGGPDFLTYALLDAVIDGYFPILERYSDKLEDLEDEVLLAARARTISQIHKVKHDLRTLRRVIWPQREACNALLRDENAFIKPETRVYLRDCYDHTVQCLDLVETARELCADLMDVYLSSVSNRMNEVMRVLTVISTIFIPLSFVASVYGMNFQNVDAQGREMPWNMPELHYRYGYPIVLAFMGTTMVGMLGFFWKRGWLRSFTPTRREQRAAAAASHGGLSHGDGDVKA